MSKAIPPITPFLFLAIISLLNLPSNAADQLVPAMFIFGDSIVDSGNNNWIIDSSSYNDWLPYGVDFPSGPTGRFTNNKTVADALGQKLGLPHFAPIFNNPNTTGGAILNGVNYASAGSGILDATDVATGVIPLSHQIKDFIEVTYPELEEQLGNQTAAFMASSIFMFNCGANDYAFECFYGQTCNFSTFTPTVVSNYTTQLKRLYNMGVRKFVLFAVQPVGCSPYGRKVNDSGGCENIYNKASAYFNAYLRSKIDDIQEAMPESYVVFFDAMNAMMEIISDPSAYGLKVINDSCCSTSKSSAWKTCIVDGDVCSDRSTYLYFDGVHPTDATNEVLSEWALTTTRADFIYPYNVAQLASIHVNTSSSSLLSKPSIWGTYDVDVQ